VPRTRARSISTRAIVARTPLRADQQGRVVENGPARANSTAGMATKQLGPHGNHGGLRQKSGRRIDARRRELGPTEGESGQILLGRRFERALGRFHEGTHDFAGDACATGPRPRALRTTGRATKLRCLTANPFSESPALGRDPHRSRRSGRATPEVARRIPELRRAASGPLRPSPRVAEQPGRPPAARATSIPESCLTITRRCGG